MKKLAILSQTRHYVHNRITSNFEANSCLLTWHITVEVDLTNFSPNGSPLKISGLQFQRQNIQASNGSMTANSEVDDH